MLLANLPIPIQFLILVVGGAIIGSLINWAIYSWTYILKNPISPWMKPHSSAAARTAVDRIPIVGWWFMRCDFTVFGKGFWIRPMLIEIVWAIGLPWFYYWQMGGGLAGGQPVPLPESWNMWAETWFLGHSILIALMFIATFIDFDERMIPDYVTIPGTIIALLFAAFCPWFRLPELLPNLAGKTVEPIHFFSAWTLPAWHHTAVGLLVGIAIFMIWILALLPKLCTMRYGFFKGIKLMIASIVRPKRKTRCQLRSQRRGPFGISLALLCLGLLGSISIIAAKMMLPPENWDSLFGALFGLGFGGGMVWTIRIVARYAMNREAMGFGDVTLMAMIGAFLGWQVALLTFGFSPFAALVVALICFLITKDNEIAFGPYLCIACLFLMIFWQPVWEHVRFRFFAFGPLLFPVLAVLLVLFAGMLYGIQEWKDRYLSEELEA